jgi:2-dehydropantoate 2-reductase
MYQLVNHVIIWKYYVNFGRVSELYILCGPVIQFMCVRGGGRKDTTISTEELDLKVAIVGPGAVGTALLSTLHEGGFTQVTLVGRDGFVDESREVKTFAGKTRWLQSRIPDRAPAKFDIVFITTRAFDVEAALGSVPLYAEAGAVVVTLNNGYLVDEICNYAQNELADYSLRVGMTSLSAVKDQEVWRLTNGEPATVFGPIDKAEAATPAEHQLTSTLRGFGWEQNPLPFIRRKWLFNVAINGLCGYHSLARNGLLTDHQADVMAVVKEAYQWGESQWGPWAWREDEMLASTLKLIRDTSDNENSLVRDLKVGRQTEMRYLAGILEDGDGFPWLEKLRQQLL